MLGHNRLVAVGATAIASLVLLVVPVFGLEHIVVTKPVLEGALAFAARRYALNGRNTVASVASLPLAWVSVGILVDASVGIDMSGNYRFAVWLSFTVLLLGAVGLGTWLAGRGRPTADRRRTIARISAVVRP